jgi:hypothetical protein
MGCNPTWCCWPRGAKTESSRESPSVPRLRRSAHQVENGLPGLTLSGGLNRPALLRRNGRRGDRTANGARAATACIIQWATGFSGLVSILYFPSVLQPVLPAPQFLFGLQPILFTLALPATLLDMNLIRALSDVFMTGCGGGNRPGTWGTKHLLGCERWLTLRLVAALDHSRVFPSEHAPSVAYVQ